MKEILVGNNVLEFPDDMSPKDIARVIDAQLPELDPAALKDPAAKEAWAKRTTAAQEGAVKTAMAEVGDTWQGLETSAKIGWNALGKAVNTLRGTQDIRPTIRQEYRAYREAQDDPAYAMGLAQTDDPRRIALLEQRLGPRARLEQRLADRNAAVLGSRQAAAEQAAREAGLPRSEAQRDLAAQIGVANQWAAWRRNPVELTAAIALESLAPSLAGAAAGTVIGGPGPGTAAGVGLSSFGLTLSSELLGYAQQDGINIQDPDAFGIWLDSPAFDRAFDKARDKATVVAGVDAATAGIAGRFIGPALRQGLRQTVVASGKELALQMAGGATGEAAGQLVAGQPVNTFDIGMEAFAEIVSGPGEVAANIREAARPTQPSPPAVPSVPSRPIPEPRPTAETLTAAQAEAGLTDAPPPETEFSPIERLITNIRTSAQPPSREPSPTDLDYGTGGELQSYGIPEAPAPVPKSEVRSPKSEIPKAIAEPRQAATPRDWELFAERLAADLDAFHPARNTGARDYDLIDAAQRFADFAAADTSGKGPLDLLKQWGKSDESVTPTQLRKIRESVKSIEEQATPATPKSEVRSPKSEIPPPTAPSAASAQSAVKPSQAAAVAKEAATPPVTQQSAPFDTKAARGQKKFLLEEVDRAIADAPESHPPRPADADQLLLDDTRYYRAGETKETFEARQAAAIDPLYEKYQIPKEDPYQNTGVSGAERRERLQAAIRRQAFVESEKVLIEVPGDGTFEIINTKEALQAFRERANKFPTTNPRPSKPSKPRSTPTSPAPLAKPKTPADTAKALQDIVATDDSRKILQVVYSDGKQMVATDGRRMVRTDVKAGGTEKNPQLYSTAGQPVKVEGSYPKWNQVIPKDTAVVARDLDSARWFTVAKQAQSASSEKSHSAVIHLNRDGSLGISLASPDIGDYTHNVQPRAVEIAALDVNYLLDAINTMRRLGHEKFDLETASPVGLGPVVFRTKGTEIVQMPMRTTGPDKRTASSDARFFNALKRRQESPSKSSTSRGYAPPPGTRPDAASAAGQAWPGADLGTPAPPGPVDDPNHSAFPVELPELVWFAQQLGKGKFPRLRERLRGALGRFNFVQGQPASGRISLLRSLFQLVTPEETARIIEAANDYAKALGLDPKETERVAKEKAQFEIDQLRQEREKQNPLLASKVLAHEIGHWIDFLPQAMIAGRGNILGRIASLADYLKTTMPAHYGGDFEQVLTKQDRAKLRRQAERETGKRPPKDEEKALLDWQQQVSERYAELVENEISARGLISTKLIKEELEPLIAWWRGSGESMEEYFADADEMFAEALSVFLNNPQAMQKRAPQFYAAWMSWMEAKPAVRKLWTDIQNGIRSGQIHKDRVTRLLDSWDRLDAQNLDRANRRRLRSARHYLDNVAYHLSDTFGPVYRLAGKTYSRLGDLRQAIGDFRYRATEHELFLGRINREVGGRLVNAALDWKWLGELMFHRHIVNNRKDIANPHGWNVKASSERLAAMEAELGPDRWRTLNEARAMFRTIYEDMVVRPINASGMFRKELLDAVNERVFYATFAASQGPAPQSGIEALIDFYAGNGVGSQIYKQVGHLGDVQNPATATVLKALSLMSAMRRNAVKRELVDLMQANDPANIKPADQRWTGQRREFKTIESPTVGTVTYLEDGKPKAFYVPRLMADTVNQAPASQNELWLMYNRAMGWVKAAFTQLNYGFWPVNYLKDTVGWNLQVPGANPVAYARLLPRALAAARASVKQRNANPDAEAALRRLVLISKADPRGVWATASDELERRILSYGMDPRQWDALGKKAHGIVRLWNEYRELGQTFERVNKIAGMLHLDEKFPSMPEWQKREIIRERAGSPDFLRRGASATGADIVMMFYNPWKEGLRSLAKTARDNPYSFTGKMLLAIGTPTTLMALAAAGGMGDDKKRQYAAVPDYDLSNYIVWPLGWVDESRQKVAYLRLPLWEPARIFHGLLWHALTGRGKSINSYLGGQVPGLSPVVSTASDWWQFAQGQNPYDSFRNREVIDPDIFVSDKAAAARELAKHTWNEFGGGLLMRFDQEYLGDPEPGDLEKFLKLPFISNLLGRWVKVSNRGVFEQDRKLSEEIEKARAGIRVAVDKSIVRLQQGEALTEAEVAVLLDPYGMEYFTQKFIDSELSRSSLFLQRMQRIPTQQGRISAITNNPAGIAP